MDLRVKHSLETRIEVARLFDAGFGFHAIATQLGLKRESVRNWHDQYMQGRLLDSAVMGNKKYSPQLKIAAVEKFLSGTPKQDVLVEFDISTRAVFDKWVVIYRNEGPEGLSKTAGRKARGDGPLTPEEELAFLRMENEILKKWVALAQEEDRRLSGL